MTKATGERMGSRIDGNRWPPLPLMENEKVIEAPADRDMLTKRYTERALRFIEQNQKNAFFVEFVQIFPS